MFGGNGQVQPPEQGLTYRTAQLRDRDSAASVSSGDDLTTIVV